MDNNMKLLAKIVQSRFNLIALIFQNLESCGGMPDSLRRSVLVYPKVIKFFIAIAFSGPPSNILPSYTHMF